MAVNVKKLVEHYKREPQQADRFLRESLQKKEINPKEISLAEVFIECFGYDVYKECQAKKRLAADVMQSRLSEAEGAVTTASFQNISGQIVYSSVLEQYKREDFVFSSLIPEEPITNGTLEGEKIAGITRLGDETQIRDEAEPYSLAGVGEDWIFAPAVKDRGFIVPLTWEAIFADRTGQLIQMAGDLAFESGYNKEVRAIDCLIDENRTEHRYNWRGTVIQSYGDNSGSHTWDNLAASNGLVDWTDIDAAEQVFNQIVDPYTGQPLLIEPRHIVVTKQLEQTARRIISATEIRVATPGYAVSGNPTETHMANPYSNKYELKTSRLLAQRLNTDTTWFLGDLTKYARYRVAEPMNVIQAPPNNHDEFHRRIVMQFRVNERGAFYVRQPRAIVKCTVA